MSADAVLPDQSGSDQHAAEQVEDNKGDLHHLVGPCVSEPVVFEDNSDVHAGVRALSNEHTPHDIVCRHAIRQRVCHPHNACHVVEEHRKVDEAVDSHGYQVVDEVTDCDVDHILLELGVLVTA